MIYDHLPTFQTINRMFPVPKQEEERGNHLFLFEVTVIYGRGGTN